MKAFQPYLNFDGNAREAMTFYHQCLGGQLDVQSFADAKMAGPLGSENRVMHARITNGNATLMASDTMPGHPFAAGTNYHVNVDCDTNEEIDRIFSAFSDGARVNMPLQDTFWGARFGMLTDKYGVNWMFNCEQKKS